MKRNQWIFWLAAVAELFAVGYGRGSGPLRRTIHSISFQEIPFSCSAFTAESIKPSISLNQLTQQIKDIWFIGFVDWFHWLIDFILVNNGARWIFTSFSLVIMALMLGNRFETSHYASYECGLFQKTVARVKYEITFYTVALTFLIFEYELLFIFPLLLSLQVSHKSF